MTHYKPTSRLATRSGATPSNWLATCSQIGIIANEWAGRNDLAVYAGEDAGMGQAIACFIGTTAEIEINLAGAFGKATSPSMVGDFTLRSTQYDWAEPTGVIYHEALHARSSDKWDYSLFEVEQKNGNANVVEVFFLLEESRIERIGVLTYPKNRVFLRASALGLALGEIDEDALAKVSEVRVMAKMSGLALARVDAGVLDLADVANIYSRALDVLGEELFSKLRSVWVRFQNLSNGATDAGLALAREWVELLREADPEGESGEGGCGIEFVLSAIEDMDEDASGMAISVAMDIDDQQTQEEWAEEVKGRSQKSKKQNEERKVAENVFQVRKEDENANGSKSRSRLLSKRVPQSGERASAVKIAQMLEKAKYRERSVHIRKTHAPLGKLNIRNAVQNSAMKSKGLLGELPAWKSKSRKHTDDPTLKIGVMVDISSSMTSAMDAMATTAWVLGEAGRRIQAQTAMVYFGQDVFATLKVGQKLEEVSVWSASDGTEVFGKGFSALNGTLGLTYSDGVRMLVVVSDGNYTSDETEKAKEIIRDCEANGVAVLFITPKNCYAEGARNLTSGTHAVHLDGMEVETIALAIGKSASDALAKVGGGV
jgi:hypothetical protein